ncbi:MAG: hypothetical protein AAFY26_00230 [Cyanobacteria bacterium J06638_22]
MDREKQLDWYGGVERSQPIDPLQLPDMALLQGIPSSLNPAKILGHLLPCPDDQKNDREIS